MEVRVDEKIIHTEKVEIHTGPNSPYRQFWNGCFFALGVFFAVCILGIIARLANFFFP